MPVKPDGGGGLHGSVLSAVAREYGIGRLHGAHQRIESLHRMVFSFVPGQNAEAPFASVGHGFQYEAHVGAACAAGRTVYSVGNGSGCFGCRQRAFEFVGCYDLQDLQLKSNEKKRMAGSSAPRCGQLPGRRRQPLAVFMEYIRIFAHLTERCRKVRRAH